MNLFNLNFINNSKKKYNLFFLLFKQQKNWIIINILKLYILIIFIMSQNIFYDFID